MAKLISETLRELLTNEMCSLGGGSIRRIILIIENRKQGIQKTKYFETANLDDNTMSNANCLQTLMLNFSR